MIYIIPDTSMLYISYKQQKKDLYSAFTMNSFWNELLNLREERMIDSVRILFPETVISELLAQRVKAYESDMQKLNELIIKMGIEESYPLISDYEDKQRKQVIESLEKEDVKVLPICGFNYFEDIIDKAFRKEAPFEGKEGESDKGFKDTLLFYSVLDYATKHNGMYYILSKDIRLSSQTLMREFYINTGNGLRIYDSIQDVKNEIVVCIPDNKLESLGYEYQAERIVLEEKQELVGIELNYKKPLFKGDSSLERILNKRADRLFNADLEYWNYVDREKKWHDDPEVLFQGSMEGEVCFNERGILSVLYRGFRYIGGIHGNTTYSADTFLLSEGRRIRLSELLGTNETELNKMIIERAEEDLRKSKKGKYYYDTVRSRDADSVVYYIKEGIIHIVFNEGEMGPYSSGAIDLELCGLD